MRIYFWGTRGSLPASLNAPAVQAKVRKALKTFSLSHHRPGSFSGPAFRRIPFPERATFGCNTSCVEVSGGDSFVICDAGSGLRDFGQHVMERHKRGKVTFPATFHIFMSHFHWDHIQGFPFFPPAYIPGNRVFVYGGHPDIRSIFERQMAPPFFPVPLSVMQADLHFNTLSTGTVHEIAGLRVSLIRQNHPGDSYGYRFESGGKAVVYTTDAEHRDFLDEKTYPFVDFCRHADLLIMDAQYDYKDAFTIRENWGHSNNITAVELAVRADIRHLCLFHSEHTCSDELLDRFLRQTRRYAELHSEGRPPRVDMAYDGMRIRI